MGVPQTVSYVNGSEGLLVINDGSNSTFYLYGIGQIAEYGSEWSYPLRDSNASVRQSVDGNANLISASSYKPFGATLSENGTYESLFGFAGAQVDRLSGLLYANGRYYDPVTGRYLMPDYGQQNPYAPRQGPWWLLLPLIGIVFVWKGRKSGPWRMLILVSVVGAGLSLVSCTQQPEPDPIPPVLSYTQYEDIDLSETRDIPWRDEKDPLEWATYPNSCGPAALYTFLEAEGKNVIYSDLIKQLQNEGTGSYDGYCCSNELYGFGVPVPTATPHPPNQCNKICTSAETLATVARKYYSLDIESHDFWSKQKVYEKLRAEHPVLALVRAYFTTDDFGHFVVITGLQDNGETVRVYDSYPDAPSDTVAFGNTIIDNEAARQAAGMNVAIEWDQFEASWSSDVDPKDPLLDPALRKTGHGHVRWAMSVR